MTRRRRARLGVQSGPPFSLFAFQDIMAAVTGVMIVVTLLLMLDLLTRVVATETAMASSTDVRPPLEPSFEQRAAALTWLEQEAAAEVVTPGMVDRLRSRVEAERQRVETLEQTTQASWREGSTAEQARVALERSSREVEQRIAALRERAAAAWLVPAVTLLEGQRSGRPTWWVRLTGGRVEAAPLESDRPAGLDNVTHWPDVDGFLASAGGVDAARRGWVLLVEPRGVEDFDRVQSALRSQGFDVGWDLAPVSASTADPKLRESQP